MGCRHHEYATEQDNWDCAADKLSEPDNLPTAVCSCLPATDPAMITGPILFSAQNGQWIEQIGRLAGGLEPTWPSKNDMYYDLIDVRDLCAGHRLAMESAIDHLNSHGGPR